MYNGRGCQSDLDARNAFWTVVYNVGMWRRFCWVINPLVADEALISAVCIGACDSIEKAIEKSSCPQIPEDVRYEYESIGFSTFL